MKFVEVVENAFGIVWEIFGILWEAFGRVIDNIYLVIDFDGLFFFEGILWKSS